jgi:hypothetical protein
MTRSYFGYSDEPRAPVTLPQLRFMGATPPVEIKYAGPGRPKNPDALTRTEIQRRYRNNKRRGVE